MLITIKKPNPDGPRLQSEVYVRHLYNIEIRGIPCTQGEDCMVFIETIDSIIGFPITSFDIDVVHHVSTKDKGNKNITA